MKGLFGNKYILAIATAYAMFFIVGSANTVINSTIAELTSFLSVDITRMGAVFSVFGLGRMATLFISGVLTDKLGSKKLMIGASLLFIIFFAVVPISRHLYIVMSVAFLAGAGNGMVDASGMPLLMDCFKNSGTSAISFAQLFFGVGAFLTPLSVGFLLKNELDWTYIYWGLTSVVCIILVFQTFLKFPASSQKATAKKAEAVKPAADFAVKPSVRREGAILGILTFLCGCIVSIIMVWTVSYLSVCRFAEETAAVQTLAFYNLGGILSALIVARLSKKIHAASFMVINLSIALIGLLISMIFSNELMIKISYAIIGVGCGTLYSLSVTLAGELFHEKKGTAVGAILTASALSGVITPFLTSVLIGLLSLEKMYYTTFIILGLSIITALMFKKKYPATNKQFV